MSRDRTEVLHSIALLIKEVNAVAVTLKKDVPSDGSKKSLSPKGNPTSNHSNVFPIKRDFDGLISKRQIEQVVEILVNSYQTDGKTADRETLQTLVDQLIRSTINGWISKNLESVVTEAVEREINRTIDDKRLVG